MMLKSKFKKKGLTDNNMLSSIKLPHVLPHRGTSDASMTLSPHVVPEGHYDLLDLLGQLPGRRQDESLALG